MSEFDDLFDDDAPVDTPSAPAPAPPTQQAAQPVATGKPLNTRPRAAVPLWLKVTVPLIAIACILVGVVIGVIVGASSADTPKPVKTAAAVKGQSSVLKHLDNLKDSKLRALADKLRAVRMASTSPDVRLQGYGLLVQDIANDQPKIDSFLDKLYALKPTADSGAKETVRKDIAQYMTGDAGSTVAYDAVSGPSPAKMLGQPGVKSAQSMILPWKTTAKGSVYIVITPFTTDKGTSYAVAVIGVSAQGGSNAGGGSGRLIYAYKFTGVLTGTEVGSVEKALASMADSTDVAHTAAPTQAGGQPPLSDTGAGDINPPNLHENDS